MAELTVAEDIAKLESRLNTLDGKIDKQESLRELEEGGQGARFRTSFTNITELYNERAKVAARLRTLRMSV